MKVISALAVSIAVMFLIAIMTPSALAQETNALLPEPGILPDNHLYVLKRVFEMIWTSWTFSNDARASRALELAQTRLAEARAMANADKSEFVASLLDQYTTELENANRLAAALTDDKKPDVSEKIAVVTSGHISVLDDMEKKVPDNAKPAVIMARENSIKENMQAIEDLGAEKPEKAAEIAKYVAQASMKDAFEANRGGNQHEVQRALKEGKAYEDLANRLNTNAKEVEKYHSEGKQKSDNLTKSH